MDETPGPRRRSVRDWIVDVALVALAFLFGLTAFIEPPHEPSPPPDSPVAVTVETAVLTAGCAALWWRRRWPLQVAGVLVAASAFFVMVGGAMLVALFSLAVHRPPRTSLPVFGVGLLAAFVNIRIHPEQNAPDLVMFLLSAAMMAALTGWGISVRHRRELVDSLRERAVHAEGEARLRAERVQHQVRESIAREIHDVLGHRLSMLSVHAGALEYRPDASEDEVRRSAQVIRESAHQALQDLREVIGVLRAPVGELPQPTMADLRRLVAEADHVGASVVLSEDYEGSVPERTGRAAYRIVQEALTNVRKHSPGADTRVLVSGAPGGELRVEVANGPSPTPEAEQEDHPAGSGQGLVGLAERVSLASGRLEHGPTADGGWRLRAWLPWPT
ncbi:sensor histidine kinase [Nocardiopsis salina]|uniref:sensor histidine kinase n=1 Tax=Nocardiopsis salina TaxID=245836 RepID=UPI000348C925|nr:histidine kinase [Nocardiopsis salina]